MRTPWGESDSITILAPGVYRVTTPSHGGFKVDSPLLDKIPVLWRRASFNKQGLNGWFEEDCDWCMVALAFPKLFPPEALVEAQATFNYWIAPKVVKVA